LVQTPVCPTSFLITYLLSFCRMPAALVSPLLLSFLAIGASPPDVYTLSLHDALPIFMAMGCTMSGSPANSVTEKPFGTVTLFAGDRKSTRLNSSHQIISYAVFCLQKKKREGQTYNTINKPNQPIYRHTRYNVM